MSNSGTLGRSLSLIVFSIDFFNFLLSHLNFYIWISAFNVYFLTFTLSLIVFLLSFLSPCFYFHFHRCFYTNLKLWHTLQSALIHCLLHGLLQLSLFTHSLSLFSRCIHPNVKLWHTLRSAFPDRLFHCLLQLCRGFHHEAHERNHEKGLKKTFGKQDLFWPNL